MVARRFYKLFHFAILRTHARGRRHLSQRGPLILVSNHAGSFGPISVMTSLPVRLHPWVTYEVTDVARAAERIRREFMEEELHLKPPLSAWLARVVARICVALMRDLGAVPVYDRSRKIRDTVSRSLSLLEQGRSILVFPENAATPVNGLMREFCTGFIHVAKLYYEKTRRAVTFLPVAVNKRVQGIMVGEPIAFDGTTPFHAEKLRLKRELTSTIERLYEELDRDAGAASLGRAGSA